ncbi:MAG: 3-keto-5-aminohexanoate cleavage protein [Gemmatimonadaceae bacterium]
MSEPTTLPARTARHAAEDAATGWRYADAAEYLERVRQGMPPLIICCACNGGMQGKEYNPAIPEMAEEIADSVYDAYRAGAAMVHVHARDPENLPGGARTVEAWRAVTDTIRERCPDIIINNTTGGSPGMADDERLASLDAGPDMASLNLTPDMSRIQLKAREAPLPHPRGASDYDDCWPISYRLVSWYAREMRARGIKPELETYHTGGAWVIRDLIAQGLIERPYWVQTVMGYQTASYPTADHVLHLLRDLPEGALWLCAGIGPHQLPMTTLATLLGGHVRVGLEDNIYYRRGELARSNAQLVERAARVAHELNRDVATAAQARAMLGLEPAPAAAGGA